MGSFLMISASASGILVGSVTVTRSPLPRGSVAIKVAAAVSLVALKKTTYGDGEEPFGRAGRDAPANVQHSYVSDDPLLNGHDDVYPRRL